MGRFRDAYHAARAIQPTRRSPSPGAHIEGARAHSSLPETPMLVDGAPPQRSREPIDYDNQCCESDCRRFRDQCDVARFLKSYNCHHRICRHCFAALSFNSTGSHVCNRCAQSLPWDHMRWEDGSAVDWYNFRDPGHPNHQPPPQVAHPTPYDPGHHAQNTQYMATAPAHRPPVHAGHPVQLSYTAAGTSNALPAPPQTPPDPPPTQQQVHSGAYGSGYPMPGAWPGSAPSSPPVPLTTVQSAPVAYFHQQISSATGSSLQHSASWSGPSTAETDASTSIYPPQAGFHDSNAYHPDQQPLHPGSRGADANIYQTLDGQYDYQPALQQVQPQQSQSPPFEWNHRWNFR